MFYTIYKITNKLNGKSYIGKHQTKELDDGYMGSGKLIRRAIQKHGVENFHKEILHVFETEVEMNEAEKSLVVLNENSYNLCPGGQGGFGYLNSLPEAEERRLLAASLGGKATKGKRNISSSERLKKLHREGRLRHDTFAGKTHSEKSKKKMSETRKTNGSQKGVKNSQYGKPRSEETKAKIRATLLAKRQQLASFV